MTDAGRCWRGGLAGTHHAAAVDDPRWKWSAAFSRQRRNGVRGGAGGATLPLRAEIAAETFLPSSRSVAFRKAPGLQQAATRMLEYCEDLTLRLRLREIAARPPSRRTRWSISARAIAGSLFQAVLPYARGDGKATSGAGATPSATRPICWPRRDPAAGTARA